MKLIEMNNLKYVKKALTTKHFLKPLVPTLGTGIHGL